MDTTLNHWAACLLLTGCLLPAVVGAAEVYRWTDERGQVHYGQRPPPDGAQRLELPQSQAGTAAQDPHAAQRRARQQRLLEAYEYEREKQQAEAARVAAQQQEAATRCRELKRSWRRLSFPGPVYFTLPDGERDYLSDERRAAEKRKMLPAYTAACGAEPGTQ
jgi:hypothetical protein